MEHQIITTVMYGVLIAASVEASLFLVIHVSSRARPVEIISNMVAMLMFT